MNSKDKMLIAMTKGLKSDFPVVIPYISIFLRDHWDEITDQPWWLMNYNIDPLARLKVEQDLQRKLDLDWVQCGMCPSKEWRMNHKIETQRNRTFLVNILGKEKKEIKRQPISGEYIPIEKEPLIKSVEDIDKFIEVTSAENIIQSGKLDYAKLIVEKFSSNKFICATISSPYWAALNTYFGFKGMVLNLYKRPKLIHYVLEKITEQSIEVLKAYGKVGINGIWIEECLSSASEISLNYFKNFVLPYNKELISEIKRLGMKSIYYCCGNIYDRLELIIEADSDCISVEEGKKGFRNDISYVNKVVAGRACIFGNLDAIKVLQNGTTEELRREIRRQISVGYEYGKFVMSLGSPVTPQTPTSRVKEYIEIARQESKNIL
ncbi:MAG: uroporphyrinogen decarboxylase family protein [Candidatus Methanomethylicaceae archaeon]